jgi:hypothetical protein
LTVTPSSAVVTPSSSPAAAPRLQLTAGRRLYADQAGRPAVEVYALNDGRNQVGQVIWLLRPAVRVDYLADGRVGARYQQRKTSGGVVLATSGGYTSLRNGIKKPDGLTIEAGRVVNAIVMPDRDGVVMVSQGGINVLNLDEQTFLLPGGDGIQNPLASLVAFAHLLDWAKRRKATLFQTHLLAYSDKLLIDATRAPTDIRERRLLGLVRDRKTSELHHVIVNVPKQYNLAAVAQDAFAIFAARGKRVEALLNLDTGSGDVLEVFDAQGRMVQDVRGTRPPEQASNLLVYLR